MAQLRQKKAKHFPYQRQLLWTLAVRLVGDHRKFPGSCLLRVHHRPPATTRCRAVVVLVGRPEIIALDRLALRPSICAKSSMLTTQATPPTQGQHPSQQWTRRRQHIQHKSRLSNIRVSAVLKAFASRPLSHSRTSDSFGCAAGFRCPRHTLNQIIATFLACNVCHATPTPFDLSNPLSTKSANEHLEPAARTLSTSLGWCEGRQCNAVAVVSARPMIFACNVVYMLAGVRTHVCS